MHKVLLQTVFIMGRELGKLHLPTWSRLSHNRGGRPYKRDITVPSFIVFRQTCFFFIFLVSLVFLILASLSTPPKIFCTTRVGLRFLSFLCTCKLEANVFTIQIIGTIIKLRLQGQAKLNLGTTTVILWFSVSYYACSIQIFKSKRRNK